MPRRQPALSSPESPLLQAAMNCIAMAMALVALFTAFDARGGDPGLASTGPTAAVAAAPTASLVGCGREGNSDSLGITTATAVGRKLADLKVGERAYTVPWGMSVDLNRKGWLHPEYPVRAASSVDELFVEHRTDGYHVWLPRGSWRGWTPSSERGYLSPEDTKYIPVVAMTPGPPSCETSATGPTLPEEAIEHTVSRMNVGETAYTTPWGVWLDAKGKYWLHPHYSAHHESFGTAEMRVERRTDGYHVWPPEGEKYDRVSVPGYFSPPDTQYLPVKVHR